MNSNKVLAALALASTASASLSSCNSQTNLNKAMTAFALGLQTDTTDVSTDCYLEVDSLSDYFDNLVSSLRVVDSTNWADPVANLQSFGIQSTNVFAACDSNAFATQLTTRTTTLGGLFEVLVTVGTPLYRQFYYNDAGAADEDLYAWWQTMTKTDGALTTTADCEASSTAAGQIYSLVMNAQTPDAVYFDDLGDNWGSDF